jgi:phage terminase small subunit
MPILSIMAQKKTKQGTKPNQPAEVTPITSPLPNPKQEALCQEYLDPESEGFANKSKAGQLAGYDASHARLLLQQNPTINNRIAGIMLEIGLDHKVRAENLKKVITGTHVRRTVTHVTGTDLKGNAVDLERVTESSPSAGEVAKAVEVANKTDGTYQQQQAAADAIGSELKSIFKTQRRDIERMKK